MSIKTRQTIKSGATVERLFEDDELSVTLALFEYSYQADIFAKAISKETDGAIVVRTGKREYADTVFERGKEIKGAHWARSIAWDENAR